MPKRARRPDLREQLLDAAADVVARDGAARLTLDRVAAEAQVSKGGLLYHFPNKQALLEGMVEHMLSGVEARLAKHQHALGDKPRAVIRSFVGAEIEQIPAERNLSLALIAAGAEDPALLAPARAMLTQWTERIEAESDDGILLLLACEGVRLLSLFNLVPGGAKGQRALLERVRAAAEGGLA
ncbi:MAG: TetR/AcrR family transcriptional regulator [Pseudomonadota bacterium]